MALDGVLKIRPWSLKTGRAKGAKSAAARRAPRGGSQDRAARVARWWTALKSAGLVLVGLTVLCAVSLGLVVSYQALLVSPFFALKNLSVSGQERLGREEVLRLAGIAPGMNLLKVNPKAVIQRLESSPWVEKAQLRRVLPDELRIHVQERRPWALLNSDGLWYLDRLGRPIKRIEAGEEFNLPVVSGLTQESAQTAQGRQDLSEAMEILSRLSRPGAPLILDQVSEIRYQLGSGATVLPVSPGPKVILGRGRMGLKMEHWQKVLADLRGKGMVSQVEYIDLRLGDKAFVGLKAG